MTTKFAAGIEFMELSVLIAERPGLAKEGFGYFGGVKAIPGPGPYSTYIPEGSLGFFNYRKDINTFVPKAILHW